MPIEEPTLLLALIQHIWDKPIFKDHLCTYVPGYADNHTTFHIAIRPPRPIFEYNDSQTIDLTLDLVAITLYVQIWNHRLNRYNIHLLDLNDPNSLSQLDTLLAEDYK